MAEIIGNLSSPNITGKVSASDVNLYVDVSTLSEEQIEKITGPQGPQGDQGPVGNIGPRGLTGPKGDRGTYFYPHVAENGDISWTNDLDLDNPPVANIRGPIGISIPTGGVEGNVLYKNSSTDYDFRWYTLPIAVIGQTTITTSAWSSSSYTITNPSIKANSLIDIYYQDSSKPIVLKAEMTYTQVDGSLTLTYTNTPTSTIVIDGIKVVNLP